MAVINIEIVGGTLKDQHLSCNSHRHQGKTYAQTTGSAAVRSELNKDLEENQKLKNMFNPDWLVESSQYYHHEGDPENIPGHNIKVLLAMWAGQDSPSWHIVLMGHWSPM